MTRSQQHHGNMTSLQWRCAGYFRGFSSSLIRCHLKLPTLKYNRSTTKAISSRVRVNSNTFRVFALWQILTFPQTGSCALTALVPPTSGWRESVSSALPFFQIRALSFLSTPKLIRYSVGIPLLKVSGKGTDSSCESYLKFENYQANCFRYR